MRRFLLASTTLIALAAGFSPVAMTSAWAADFAPPAVIPYNWTGCFVGAQVGGGEQSDSQTGMTGIGMLGGGHAGFLRPHLDLYKAWRGLEQSVLRSRHVHSDHGYGELEHSRSADWGGVRMRDHPAMARQDRNGHVFFRFDERDLCYHRRPSSFYSDRQLT